MAKDSDLRYTVDKALDKLRKYCAYQDRCHKEVRNKLLELKIYGDELEEVISILIQDNYLNEERFSKSFVRGKYRYKKWGRIKIESALKSKNISAYCIRKGLEEIDDEEYFGHLKSLIEKKSKELKAGISPPVRYRRLRNFILGKGYLVDEFKKAFDQSLLDD